MVLLIDLIISLSVLAVLIWTPTVQFIHENQGDKTKTKFWVIFRYESGTLWRTNKPTVLTVFGITLNTILIIVEDSLDRDTLVWGSDQVSMGMANIAGFFTHKPLLFISYFQYECKANQRKYK